MYLRKTVRRNTINFAVVFAMTYASLSAHASGLPVAMPASIAEVKEVLHLAGLDKLVLMGARNGLKAGNSNGLNPIDIDVYLSFATLDTINDHMAPIFSQYLTHDYAQKLIAAYATPMGKLSVRFSMINFASGSQGTKAEFSKLNRFEQRALNDFNNSIVVKSLINAETKAATEMRQIFSKWSSEVMNARMMAVRKELASIMENELKAEGAEGEFDAVAAFPKRIAPSGIIIFDQEAYANFKSFYKYSKLNRDERAEIQKVELKDFLKPENLISLEAIEKSNLKLLAMENLLDTYSKSSESLLEEYKQDIEKIQMPAERRQATLAKTYDNLREVIDLDIRSLERNRAFTEIAKRILSFCESRQGKMKRDGDRLLFQNGKDVDAYNALLVQLNKEVDEVKKIEQEDIERRKKTIEKMKKNSM